MWKFMGILMLTLASFALGYYFGQRPVGTLQETVGDLQHSLKEMSRNVVDTTMGIERDLQEASASRYKIPSGAGEVGTSRQELRGGGQTARRGRECFGKRHEGREAQ